MQLLGLRAFTAGAWVRSLVRELRFGEWHDGAMNKCLQTVVLENTLETPLDSKEIKPINPKGNQPWIFSGRTDAEAEALIFWSPNAKNRRTGKDPDAGKDWRQEEKGTDDRRQDGWMASLTQWTWAWANSGRWWRTGKPGVLQSMGGSQRVRHDWATEQQLEQPKTPRQIVRATRRKRSIQCLDGKY